MGIAFITCMVSLIVLLVYTAIAHDNSLNVPSFPMTQLEAKTLDIKGRISDQKNRLLIEANSNDTRIYAGGIS
jgi:hypothetical protein